MLKRFLWLALFLTPCVWAGPSDELDSQLQFDVVKVEVGMDLVAPLVSGQPAPLLKQMGEVRQQLEDEQGFVLPGVRFRDSHSLKPKEYVIFIREQEVGRGQVDPPCSLPRR